MTWDRLYQQAVTHPFVAGAAVVGAGLVLRAFLRGAPHLPARFGGHGGRTTGTALHIVMEARPGKEAEVEQLSAGIGDHVAAESATRPWFGVRRSRSVFEIFQTFPNEAGRVRHLAGRGALLLLRKSNARPQRPTQIDRLDVLAAKSC